MTVASDSFHAVETRLRQLHPDEQRATAVELASVVLPLADLSDRGQPEQGLVSVAETIRAGVSLTHVDEARHLLFAMSEMGADEEPGGLAWFTFGASVAWIYAADANTTSPSDGVVHTFTRVADVLDALDDELGDTALLEELLLAVGASSGRAGYLSALTERVREAGDRLRS
jgi:hypothetical protein